MPRDDRSSKNRPKRAERGRAFDVARPCPALAVAEALDVAPERLVLRRVDVREAPEPREGREAAGDVEAADGEELQVFEALDAVERALDERVREVEARRGPAPAAVEEDGQQALDARAPQVAPPEPVARAEERRRVAVDGRALGERERLEGQRREARDVALAVGPAQLQHAEPRQRRELLEAAVAARRRAVERGQRRGAREELEAPDRRLDELRALDEGLEVRARRGEHGRAAALRRLGARDARDAAPRRRRDDGVEPRGVEGPEELELESHVLVAALAPQARRRRLERAERRGAGVAQEPVQGDDDDLHQRGLGLRSIARHHGEMSTRQRTISNLGQPIVRHLGGVGQC